MSVKFSALFVRVVTQAARRISRSTPRHLAVVAILPLGRLAAPIGQGCEGAVVGQLCHERLACRQFEELAVGGWDFITAAVCLHPPLGLGQVI